jgi:hypothetical protein
MKNKKKTARERSDISSGEKCQHADVRNCLRMKQRQSSEYMRGVCLIALPRQAKEEHEILDAQTRKALAGLLI